MAAQNDAHTTVDENDVRIAAEVTNLDLRVVAAELTDQLGRTMVSALSKSRDRLVAYLWISGREKPTEVETARLRTALHVLRLITKCDGADIAAHWFLGNDQGPTARLLQLREDKLDEVLAAARRYVHDNGGF